MKRSYFYFAASALVLSACTSEAVLDDAILNQNVIGFENVVKKHSRQEGDVTDLTGNGLQSFQVFGYYTLPENPKHAHKIFDDRTVTRAQDGKWFYSGEQHYWVKDARYYFYAYSCGDIVQLNSDFGTFTLDADGELTPIDRVLKIHNYICDSSHQHDLIFASNTGATAEDEFEGILGKEKANDLVSFQFKHLLSKVNAKFTSNFPDDYEITISNVTLENIRNIGNYNPCAGTDPITQQSQGGWQNVERKDGKRAMVYLLNTRDNSVNPISTSRGKDAAVTNSAFVIPYSYSGTKPTQEDPNIPNTFVYLKFQLTVTYNGEYIMTKELTGEFNPSWTAGYTYTYNIVVDGNAANLEVITFTTTTDENGNEVSGWASDGTTPNIEVNQ